MRSIFLPLKKNVRASILLFCAFLFFAASPVSALSQIQKSVLLSGSNSYDVDVAPQSLRCGPGSTGGGLSPVDNKVFFMGDSLTVNTYSDGELLKKAEAAGFTVNTEAEETWLQNNTRLKRATGTSIEAHGGKSVSHSSSYGMYSSLNQHTADFSEGNAGIIVIALGTNDTGAGRVDDMVDFIEYIHGYNQSAQIFWVNTYWATGANSGISYTTVNSAIAEAKTRVQSIHDFEIIDYATAAENDTNLRPQTGGNYDGLHIYGTRAKAKSDFILSKLPGAVNPTATTGGGTGGPLVQGLSTGQVLAAASPNGITVLPGATMVPRPFTGTRMKPTAIILHWTAGEAGTGQDVRDALASRVEPPKWPNGRSMQLAITDDAKVWQLSEALETKPAQSFPEGANDPWNQTTIGIEIESGDFKEDISAHENALLNNAAQYQSVLATVRSIMEMYNIKNESDTANRRGIFGHYEIQPGNSDPGQNFMAKIREDLGKSTGNGGVDVTGAINALTDDQKIGQTLIVGFTAQQAQSGEMLAAVQKYKLGGVYILGKGAVNSAFNKTYFDSLHSAAGIPLIVASDEEGGTVQRFVDQIGGYPSAQDLGSMSKEEVEIKAREMAGKLKTLGVNTVLAPVLDLASTTNGNFGYSSRSRVFSGDPSVVAEKGGAFAKGIRSAGLTPTYKHFPGLGGGKNTDNEESTSPDLATLKANDLKPYETLLGQHGAIVMLNSSVVPGLTEPGNVADTSPATINLLRNDYGFGGLITTDALNTPGVRGRVSGGLRAAVTKSLQAGVTMPLFSYESDKSLQQIIDAVKDANVDVSENLKMIASHKSGLAGPSASASCGGPAGFANGSDNAARAWNLLSAKGLDAMHIAAALGNFQQESGMNPEIVNSIGATGIAQWLGGRKATLLSRPKPLTIDTQINFAYDEWLGQNGAVKNFLDGDHPNRGTYEQWLAVTDIALATEMFRRSYERPGEAEANDANRIRFARDFFTRYGSM